MENMFVTKSDKSFECENEIGLAKYKECLKLEECKSNITGLKHVSTLFAEKLLLEVN